MKMLGILKLFFQPKASSNVNSVNVYTGPELSLQIIREHLLKFKGGSIDLDKNEETGIATVCINNPSKRNAVTGKMMSDFADVVSDLENWNTGKGIILYGKDKHFCSGGDLDFARKTSNEQDGFKMATFMQHVLKKFHELPLISVALIEGTGALGGGAELAVACDFRLQSDNSSGIGFVHGRMGLVPAWGGATRLVRLVGYRTALQLLSSTKIVSGPEALSIGLVDGTVRNDRALDEAKEWLLQRTKSHKDVIHAMKAIVVTAQELSFDESLAREKRIFAPLWGGSANKAALQKNIKHKL